MKRISAVFMLLVSLWAGNAFGKPKDEQCTDVVRNIVAHHLNTDNFTTRQENGNVVSESCKSWPFKPDVLLAAFAYDAGVEYQKNLIIAMISKKTKHVIASYQTVIAEDAITTVGNDSLQLDVARYQIAKDTMAFALRFKSSAIGASCGEANWNDELTLLMPKGKEIYPVLRLYMFQQKSIRGCLSVQVADAVWRNADLTISIGKKQTNGFYNVVAKANIATYTNREELEATMEREEHHVFRYNGKIYEAGQNVPWWISN